MNSKTNFLIQFVIFIAGIVLIVTHNHVDVMRWIVIFMGCAIILPALITMGAAALSGHRASADEPHAHRAARTWAVSVSIFAIVLGVAMLCAPTFFATFIAWVFAALLIAAGCYHILVVSYLSRPFVLPFWYYIIPLLLIVAGIVVMLNGVRTLNSVVVLITGIAMVCSSANALLEYVGTHPSHTPDDRLRQQIDRDKAELDRREGQPHDGAGEGADGGDTTAK